MEAMVGMEGIMEDTTKDIMGTDVGAGRALDKARLHFILHLQVKVVSMSQGDIMAGTAGMDGTEEAGRIQIRLRPGKATIQAILGIMDFPRHLPQQILRF